MDGNPAALSNVTDDFVARDRLTTARNVVHQITDTFNHHAAIVFGTGRWRCGFLRQLAQSFFIQLFRTRLFQLRLQEVHHLIQTDIAVTDCGQHFIQRVDVVARQQQFLGIFDADIQSVQLVIEDLFTGNNVLIAILFTEPVLNFRAPAAGRDVTQTWVQPVAAWVRMLLGDDFNLIAHMQLIGERHDAAANFRPDTPVPHITVDVIRKVERRGAHRQVDHVAFWRKHVDAIVEHLAAHFVEHFARIGHFFLPRDKFSQPGNTTFVAPTAATDHSGAFFVFPVRRDAQLSIFMHLTRADLHFQRFPTRPQHHSVNRLITVRFRVGDIIVELIRQMAEMSVHNP
ncbi:hypothetical protein SRABI106_03593 [Rahnella aquatilis]|nr:hypothetical protein SRABI106_03593 [Rahnella aquatilis]